MSLAPSELPDETTLEWVQSVLGRFQIRSRFAHDHGYSRLWRLATKDAHVWLKMHAFPHKWAGEVQALTRWAPSFGRAPGVIAHRADPQAVLLTEVVGYPAESLTLDAKAEERMWREAGAWLAQLHSIENDWFGESEVDGLPHGSVTTDAEELIRRMWDAIYAKTKSSGLVAPSAIEFIKDQVRERLPIFRGERARAIHRDFTPRNWMANPDGELTAVIDFEHARWDVRAMDLTRPWDHEFLRNPRLVDAFYEGYGRLDDRLRAQIETLRAMLTLSTIVWATGVGDVPFAKRYRDALDRRMAAAIPK